MYRERNWYELLLQAITSIGGYIFVATIGIPLFCSGLIAVFCIYLAGLFLAPFLCCGAGAFIIINCAVQGLLKLVADHGPFSDRRIRKISNVIALVAAAMAVVLLILTLGDEWLSFYREKIWPEYLH